MIILLFFCCLFFFESISNAFLIRFLTSFVVVDFAVLVIGATTTLTTKITAAIRAKLLIHFHAPPSLVVYLYNQKKKIKIGRKNGEKTCWGFDVISDFFKTFFAQRS